MCAVIDMNVFSLVFLIEKEGESDFKKLQKWVIDDECGKAVYGGSKFIEELEKCHRIRRFILELGRRNSALHVDDATVDSKADEVRFEVAKHGCDDEHIIALLLVSGVQILCSHDRGLHSAVSSMTPVWRAHGMTKPKIYQDDKKHAALLVSKNVAKVCRD